MRESDLDEAAESGARDSPGQRLRAPVSAASALFATRARRVEAVVIVILILAGLGAWAYLGVKNSLKDLRAGGLQTLLEAKVTAFEVWAEYHRIEAERFAGGAAVRRAAGVLLGAAGRGASGETLWASPARSDLLAGLMPMIADPSTAAVNLIDRHGRILATQVAAASGAQLGLVVLAELGPVFRGASVFLAPRPDEPLLRRSPHDALAHPLVWFVAPVRDAAGEVIAALAIGRFGERRFARLFGLGWLGETGEAYAFDEAGWMLSESRFTEEMMQEGRLERSPGGSVLRVQVREPGVSGAGASEQGPLTRLAQAAIAARGKSDPREMRGVLLDRYLNYRGAEVIGVWRWLPAFDIGVAVEVGVEEAYAPLRYLTTTYWAIFALLLLAVGIALASSFSVLRLRSQQRRIGPYRLQEQVGEGGMSRVYRAVHALLKRPTAVKILKAHLATDEVIARFEREVRLASRLSNPSTVEIYDYGRMSDGTFYYAMEFIEGLTLEQLVDSDGPQSAARTAHILRRVCESLREAHEKRLVHRDIKPQNIMLCRRGGEYDVVKVLDFGLVKELHPTDTRDITRYSRVLGTPLYMAPERIRDPADADPRVDIYAVGAVGFWLLAGRRLFDADNELDLERQVLEAAPPAPSKHAAGPVPQALDELILLCLAKDRNDRPQRIDLLLDVLDGVLREHRWRRRDAEQWWGDYQAARMSGE